MQTDENAKDKNDPTPTGVQAHAEGGIGFKFISKNAFLTRGILDEVRTMQSGAECYSDEENFR